MQQMVNQSRMNLKTPSIIRRRFNKDRLYVGLYTQAGASASNNVYDWAFVTGPKSDGPCCPITVYSAQPSQMTASNGRVEIRWAYNEHQSRMCRREDLVARVMLGKVLDTKRLASVLRRVPMRAEVEDWDSIAWMREGLENIDQDGKCLGTSVTQWRFVRDAALQLLQSDAARRMENGEPDEDERDRIPTFNMLLKKAV